MPATASNLATTMPTPSAGLPRQSSERAAAGLFMSTLDAAHDAAMANVQRLRALIG